LLLASTLGGAAFKFFFDYRFGVLECVYLLERVQPGGQKNLKAGSGQSAGQVGIKVIRNV
jgi:hypothetical protein